jgi:FMN reductase (NADPH)
MNEILEFLNSHASVRRFTDEQITDEQERLIITTAQRSPTSSNLHAYSIISVRAPDKKKRLAHLCGDQNHVEQSSLFLVFCADLYRLSRLNRQRGYPFQGDYTDNFIVATVDAALVAARALMAAQAIGLGGVMVGGIRNNPKEVCELLHLPQLVYPVMGMSLGYPASAPKLKPRLPVEAIYFKETYRDEAFDELIAAYDETMDKLGYLRGREVEPEKYPGFTGMYSWSEHTARRMASDQPGTLRPHMLSFLRKRGFLMK